LQVSAESVPLVIEEAIVCALILNELIGSSLQHNFDGPREAMVSIRFARASDGRAELSVVDNGANVPQPAHADKGQTLGLRLVDALAAQLRATFRVDRSVDSHGGAYTLTWKPVCRVAAIEEVSKPSLAAGTD
jgi:two-component sensor histidine kinase